MRKIEQEMLEALDHFQSWSKDNTKILIDKDTAKIYLFGNLIATKTDSGQVLPNLPVLLNHPTRTTCSRLRALGINVHVKKGMPFVNGTAVDKIL